MFLAYIQSDENDLVYLEAETLDDATNDLKQYVLENYDYDELYDVTILNVVGSLNIQVEKWFDELENKDIIE